MEFGTQNGEETNTRVLREQKDWSGLLMDGGFDIPNINLHREMIFDWNIVQLFEKYKVPLTFDLLSTDTDFKDFWISKSIFDGGYRPRVVISEVNASFNKRLALTVPQKFPQTYFRGTYFHGATPMAMTLLYQVYGYSLVYCESRGINCFWIRNDELSQHDVLRFNKKEHILNTIQCAQWTHTTDLSPTHWWQEIVQISKNNSIEIRHFKSSNEDLDHRRCF